MAINEAYIFNQENNTRDSKSINKINTCCFRVYKFFLKT